MPGRNARRVLMSEENSKAENDKSECWTPRFCTLEVLLRKTPEKHVQTRLDSLDAQLVLTPLVHIEVGGQRRQQYLGQVFGVGVRANLADQGRHVRVVRLIAAGPVAGARAGGLGHAIQFAVRLQVIYIGEKESPQALRGWRARPKRRGAVQERLLKPARPLVQQCVGQSGAVAEATVQRP